MGQMMASTLVPALTQPVSISCSRNDRHLHSFPTRRSSDLDEGIGSVFDQLIDEGSELTWNALRHSVAAQVVRADRSEEHTSELQSQSNLVCRLLLEKKNPAELRVHPRDENGADDGVDVGAGVDPAGFYFVLPQRPTPTLFPYTTLFRSR